MKKINKKDLTWKEKEQNYVPMGEIFKNEGGIMGNKKKSDRENLKIYSLQIQLKNKEKVIQEQIKLLDIYCKEINNLNSRSTQITLIIRDIKKKGKDLEEGFRNFIRENFLLKDWDEFLERYNKHNRFNKIESFFK